MQATTNNRKYGLGFQPGQSFMLKPEAKEGWLAYSIRPGSDAVYSLPLNSPIAVRLLKDLKDRAIEDKDFHAHALAASTAFSPLQLVDAVLI